MNKKYDEDMNFYADGYADFLVEVAKKFKPERVYLEKKFGFSDLIWGTADCLMVKKDKAAIIDYKYGKGVEVDPNDNEQLLTYAACLHKLYGFKLEKVYAFIYQPRVGDSPYAKAVYEKKELDEFCKQLMTIQSNYIKMKDKVIPLALCAEGLDHCKFCPAKSKCPEFKKEAEKKILVKIDSIEPKIPSVDELTLQQKINIFKVKKSIEKYLSDVEHSLLVAGMKGEDIGELKIVEGRSIRKWADDEAAAEGLKALGVKDPYRKSLITLGEAEKLIPGKKKEVAEKIKPLVTYTTPKKQLALPDDKRAAIGFTSVRELITEI